MVAIITGSCGLVGSEAVKFFSSKFDKIIGIDNDMRFELFGTSVKTMRQELNETILNYEHYNVDIRDDLSGIFSKYSNEIVLIIHAAGQPSHDWAVNDPIKDWDINATATTRLLEQTRLYCSDAVFIFCSTNKVYGDTPNRLSFIETPKRYECESPIDETMSIDYSLHSLMGVSKTAADLMCQEYGKYFGLKTGIFRCGCITGPGQAGAKEHGFLNYLVKCAMEGIEYTVFGYDGKQVRDNIHSYDLVTAFYEFYKNPRPGEVYNIGGGVNSTCSIVEAANIIKKISDKELKYKISDKARIGDHRWYVSDTSKFENHYSWGRKYVLIDIFKEIIKSYQ